MLNPSQFNQVVELASHHTGVQEKEIFNRSRKKAFVTTRYLIVYICRKLGIKLVYIQRFFDIRGFDICYATLFHACHRIDAEMEEDEYLRSVVEGILAQFNITHTKKKKNVTKKLLRRAK